MEIYLTQKKLIAQKYRIMDYLDGRAFNWQKLNWLKETWRVCILEHFQIQSLLIAVVDIIWENISFAFDLFSSQMPEL